MNAKRFLKMLRDMEDEISEKTAELEIIDSRLKKVTATLSLCPSKASGNNDLIGSLVAKKVELDTRINDLWLDFFEYEKKVLAVLEQVRAEKSIYYKILYKHYVAYISLADITKEEQYSYKYIVEMHGKALKCVEKILNN